MSIPSTQNTQKIVFSNYRLFIEDEDAANESPFLSHQLVRHDTRYYITIVACRLTSSIIKYIDNGAMLPVESLVIRITCVRDIDPDAVAFGKPLH